MPRSADDAEATLTALMLEAARRRFEAQAEAQALPYCYVAAFHVVMSEAVAADAVVVTVILGLN